MRFRENLLHLRQQRNMTQEQLAMLLGVSRQSVAKWESGKSTPEVDRLTRMADLFGCTLDELVSGDLSDRVVAPEEVLPEGLPARDICGYDDHVRSFAFRIATGSALAILGAAAAAFSDALNLGDAVSATGMFAGTIAALAFILPAAMDHAAFVRAHPYVEDFYTEEQHTLIRKQFTLGLVCGIGVLLVGGIVAVVCEELMHDDDLAGAIMVLLTAGGAWLLVRGGIRYGLSDLESYNKARDEARRARQDPRQGYVHGIIMLVATMVALTLLLGTVTGVLPSTAFPFFWIPWVVGGFACAIAELVMKLRQGDS